MKTQQKSTEDRKLLVLVYEKDFKKSRKAATHYASTFYLLESETVTDGLYHIIVADTVSDLVLKVNHMMDSGWIPQGGVYQQAGSDMPLSNHLWYQAMIRPLIQTSALVV